MATPTFAKEVIAPPAPPTQVKELNNELSDYLKNLYGFNYLMWVRTGKFNSIIPDLSDLKVSTYELNALANIDTSQTIQNKLDKLIEISSVGTMAYQDNNAVNIIGGNLTNITLANILNTINNLSLNNATITASDITINQGISGYAMTTGGIVFISTSSATNVDNAQTDLLYYNLAANSLNAQFSFIEIDAYGIFGANANNKRIRLYFGTTSIYDSGDIAFNGSSWHIKAKVIRNTSTAQQCIIDIITSDTLLPSSTVTSSSTANLINTNIIKCTGLSSISNDITQKGLIIKLYN